jgi:hypothetical protein
MDGVEPPQISRKCCWLTFDSAPRCPRLGPRRGRPNSTDRTACRDLVKMVSDAASEELLDRVADAVVVTLDAGYNVQKDTPRELLYRQRNGPGPIVGVTRPQADLTISARHPSPAVFDMRHAIPCIRRFAIAMDGRAPVAPKVHEDDPIERQNRLACNKMSGLGSHGERGPAELGGVQFHLDNNHVEPRSLRSRSWT